MLYEPGIQKHVSSFPIKVHDYLLAGLPVIGTQFAVEMESLVRDEE